MNRSRWAGSLAAAAAMVMLAGCASIDIRSYVERGVDLSQYRTYGWEPTEGWTTGDARLDNNPFFQERVQMAVEQGLASKGYEKATDGTPDLLLHYHASITQLIDLNELDRQFGSCDDCTPYVYDAGTLVIGLIDARTNRIVWHGSAEGSMEGMIDNQDAMEQQVDEAVGRILARFPGRLLPEAPQGLTRSCAIAARVRRARVGTVTVTAVAALAGESAVTGLALQLRRPLRGSMPSPVPGGVHLRRSAHSTRSTSPSSPCGQVSVYRQRSAFDSRYDRRGCQHSPGTSRHHRPTGMDDGLPGDGPGARMWPVRSPHRRGLVVAPALARARGDRPAGDTQPCDCPFLRAVRPRPDGRLTVGHTPRGLADASR